MSLLLLFQGLAGDVGVPLYIGDAAVCYRRVYYQANFIVPYYSAPVAATVPQGWLNPLSSTPTINRGSSVLTANQPFPFFPQRRVTADQWQSALSTAPVTVKAKSSDWQLPYYVINPVAANQWQSALSGAPAVAKAQAGYSYVPFNTAQLVVNYTVFGWYAPLSTASPVVKPQPGYSFVPFNTAQLAVNYTNYGWYQPLPVPARVTPKAAQEGFSSVPYNASFTYTNLGWYQALSTVARITPTGQQGFSFVPFDTQQHFIYTNFGWYCSLSVPAKVAMPQQGNTFVPFDTVQTTPATTTEDHIVKFIGNVGHMMLR